MTAALVKASNLQLGHTKASALFARPVSFEIPCGKIAAIIGANGCGKSTLIKSLVGEPCILSGTLSLLGESVKELTPKKLKHRAAFVPQEPRFPGHLTLHSFLGISFLGDLGWFKSTSPDSLTRMGEILALFKLDHLKDKSLSDLSSGERQRAFLARAFLQETQAILLDEPSNHLDPKATRTLAATLKQAVEENAKSVLFATHDRLLVEAIADYAIAFSNAELSFVGPMSSEGVAILFEQVFK